MQQTGGIVSGKAKLAIMYDFDGTLARGTLHDRSFIPNIGMSKDAFWKEVHSCRDEHDADEILVYMRLMLEKAKSASIQITKSLLATHGADAELFPGLSGGEWFRRINAFGASNDIAVEHYIISSGIEEMMMGCPIAKFFTKIFGSKFIYENNQAIWPAVAINYTNKTQYIFRINKQILNHHDHKSLNSYMPEHQRPIPFERMIYIGDGETDIPTMKMLNFKGGYSIAVYDRNPHQPGNGLAYVHTLLSDGRVNFVAQADYSEGSQLDITIKGIMGRIAHGIHNG
jgi:2-hydroxy-3-keto-5-methylthiopentenyl-1-phosphate phosphatase